MRSADPSAETTTANGAPRPAAIGPSAMVATRLPSETKRVIHTVSTNSARAGASATGVSTENTPAAVPAANGPGRVGRHGAAQRDEAGDPPRDHKQPRGGPQPPRRQPRKPARRGCHSFAAAELQPHGIDVADDGRDTCDRRRGDRI